MRLAAHLAAGAVLALGCLLGPSAQAQPAADVTQFVASADIQARIAKSRQAHQAGQPIPTGPIASLAPYAANLEYRTGTGKAAVHEKEAELFYVVDGSGVVVTGGQMTKPVRTNASNLSGDGIEGGQAHAVAKGDFFLVPQNTPHWFSIVNGELIMISRHVPRG
jgi:mannose-6-phosphate isomerase-like protein (cupin superfamily)